MTQEEAKKIRDTIREKNINLENEIQKKFDNFYDEWKTSHITNIENKLRRCAEMGLDSLEYGIRRMNKPKCFRECNKPSYGTEELINHFTNLGFKCTFIAGRYGGVYSDYTGNDILMFDLL